MNENRKVQISIKYNRVVLIFHSKCNTFLLGHQRNVWPGDILVKFNAFSLKISLNSFRNKPFLK